MGAACQTCAKVGIVFPNIFRPSCRFQVFKEVHQSACVVYVIEAEQSTKESINPTNVIAATPVQNALNSVWLSIDHEGDL